MNTKYVSVTTEQANLCVYMNVCLCVKVFYMAANTFIYKIKRFPYLLKPPIKSKWTQHKYIQHNTNKAKPRWAERAKEMVNDDIVCKKKENKNIYLPTYIL